MEVETSLRPARLKQYSFSTSGTSTYSSPNTSTEADGLFLFDEDTVQSTSDELFKEISLMEIEIHRTQHDLLYFLLKFRNNILRFVCFDEAFQKSIQDFQKEKALLFPFIFENFSTNRNSFSLKNKVLNESEVITSNDNLGITLSKDGDLFNENGLLGELLKNSREYQILKEEEQNVCGLLSAVCTMSMFYENLCKFDRDFTRNSLGEATELFIKMQSDLQFQFETTQSHLPGEEKRIPKVLYALQDDLKIKKKSLLSRLDRFWRKLIVVNESEFVVLTSVMDDALSSNSTNATMDGKETLLDSSISISLADVLKCYESISRTHLIRNVIDFARQLNVVLFQKVLTKNSIVETSMEMAEKKSLRFSNATLENEAGVVHIYTVFQQLITIFEFLKATIFSCSPYLEMHDLNIYLWNDLSKSLINDCLKPAIPEDMSQLPQYYRIVSEAVDRFEIQLHSLGFFSNETSIEEQNSNKLSTLLTSFVKDVENHFSEKKYIQVLERARNLMLKTDFSSVKIEGSPKKANEEEISILEEDNEEDIHSEQIPLKWFPSCQISKSIYDLVELAYSTLEEATKCFPLCAAKLFQSVRDMFDMYRSVVPIYHKSKLMMVPQIAILFYMDCMYIAHHLKVLIDPFKQRFPTPLNETATFIDMVPLFQSIGQREFSAHLIRQLHELLESVAQANGFRDVHIERNSVITQKSLQQLSHQLNQFSNVTKGVLPVKLCLCALGQLLDHVLTKIINEIESLGDISESETHILHGMFTSFSKSCRNLFPISATTKSKLDSDIEKYCPSFEKFVTLVEILEMPLAEIASNYDENKLQHLFTSKELSSLIVSLFSETQRRRALLQRIRH